MNDCITTDKDVLLQYIENVNVVIETTPMERQDILDVLFDHKLELMDLLYSLFPEEDDR
jgi:hypothetical protein